MKITPAASQELQKIIAQNDAQGLQVILQQSCCGISPVFQLVRFDPEDQPEEVEGFKILMDPEARQALEEVVIDFQDNGLVVFAPHQCGCGSDCHDHECGSGC